MYFINIYIYIYKPEQFLGYSTQMFLQKDMGDLDNHPHLITIVLHKHLPDSLMLSK